jgi:hypothetical protein
MHSTDRALAAVERELHVRIPRALFAPGGFPGFDAPIDPEALLAPGGGAVRGGELLPDALPFAGDGAGALLALRFDPAGAPAEVIAWRADRTWHPTGAVPGFPSDVDRLRARCEAAIASGLAAIAREAGAASLAQDLGVARETFSDWLLDARLVPEAARLRLRRLTGADDAALFVQDWEGAAAAAVRAAEQRPELAWPGAVLGWFEEARGRSREAARAYASALLAFLPTLDFAGRFVRPGEGPDRALVGGYERCAAPPRDPALAAALRGAQAVRTFALAESDRHRGAGRHAEAYAAALRAGWQRHVPVDMDDVLGRLGDAAEAAGSLAHAALARLHLRAWAAMR